MRTMGRFGKQRGCALQREGCAEFTKIGCCPPKGRAKTALGQWAMNADNLSVGHCVGVILAFEALAGVRCRSLKSDHVLSYLVLWAASIDHQM